MSRAQSCSKLSTRPTKFSGTGDPSLVAPLSLKICDSKCSSTHASCRVISSLRSPLSAMSP